MRLSPYYIPFADWRALADTLLAVLDPRLVPLWAFARWLAGWAVAGARRAAEHGRWAAAFGLLAILNVVLYWVFIPYRSQQRFMLQALGWRSFRWRCLLDRARWLVPRGRDSAGMHLLTPECWPFVRAGRSDSLGPLGRRAERRRCADSLVRPIGKRRARIETSNAFVSLAMLGAILVTSIFVSWAWCRISPGRPRRSSRAAIALCSHRGLPWCWATWTSGSSRSRCDSLRTRRSPTSIWAGSGWKQGRAREDRGWHTRAPTFLTISSEKTCATRFGT